MVIPCCWERHCSLAQVWIKPGQQLLLPLSHPLLQSFDSQLKAAIESITNSALSDIQYIQASLPVKDGGLGMMRVSSLALPAFLASAAGTLRLQENILSVRACSDSVLRTYLSEGVEQLWYHS